jgi:hypothetical protein
VTPTQLAALRNFYDARNGTHEPFYFYDPYETNPAGQEPKCKLGSADIGEIRQLGAGRDVKTLYL